MQEVISPRHRAQANSGNFVFFIFIFYSFVRKITKKKADRRILEKKKLTIVAFITEK
jgi:hypothetical protein